MQPGHYLRAEILSGFVAKVLLLHEPQEIAEVR